MRLSREVIALCAAVLMCAMELFSQTTSAPTRESIRVNGFEMYYEIHGAGEPLLLLHGFSGSGALWAPILPDMMADYQVIVPDLRGHGHSTNPSREFTHRQSALDVYALLDELGVHAIKAMGVSTGGMTLLHMATTQPQRIEAMVLIGATNYFPEPARTIMRDLSPLGPENRDGEVWTRMRERHHHGDEQILALFSQFHAFKDSYDDMNFTKPLLSTITARTLIVHGDRDRFFPVTIPTEIYDAIPKSYLWIIPNGSHVPIFDDTLPFFVETTHEFLRGDWETK